MRALQVALITMVLSILVVSVGQAKHNISESTKVRIGIFQLPPLNFVDEEGTAQGLYPDLLRAISHEEKWALIFVPGSWSDGYERLLSGKIDLLITVAYSAEREKVFDFSQEAVVDIWGKVYTRTDTGISNIADLAGQPVAVARKDINGINFRRTAAKFNVQPTIVEVDSHDEIFAAVQSGDAVAGVVPQHFGFRAADKYGLVPTTIEFEPFSAYFATKKGINQQLLKGIDDCLASWKKQPDSIYFDRVAYWMGHQPQVQILFHRWLKIGLVVATGGILILVLIGLFLKYQVNARTREISLREERFRKLSETTRAVPWELDVASKAFTYVGPQIRELFGYPVEAWTDFDSWIKKVHPDDRDWALKFCTENTAAGKDHDFVYRTIHRDGRIVWTHDIVAVDAGKGGSEKLYGYFVDVTEIHEHAERFQRMFRGHNAVMLLIDPQSGDIVDANEAACAFYGYAREQMIRMSMTEINVQPQSDVITAMQAAKAKTQNYFELRHRLADGEVRDVEAYSYPVDIEGQTLLFGIVHDISDRKRLMEEHGRAAQLAALGTVAAGVAHEINNPIQGIINYATLLRNVPNHPDQVSDFSQRIIREGDRIAGITRNLLDYAKDNRNEMVVSDIPKLVDNALSLLSAKIRDAGVVVKVSMADGLPQVRVNPQGFQQIVINLVDNASDALRDKPLPADKKVIQVLGCLEEIDQTPHFCLEVHDNGIGMTEETLRRAKDAFFSTKPSSQGTGLGLSIVSEIVAKHRGRLDIKSQEGDYTKIRFQMPLAEGTNS